MSLLNKIGSIFSKAEPDTPAPEDNNIDKIVEYMTERMGGIESRMDDMETAAQGTNRAFAARQDEIYEDVFTY